MGSDAIHRQHSHAASLPSWRHFLRHNAHKTGDYGAIPSRLWPSLPVRRRVATDMSSQSEYPQTRHQERQDVPVAYRRKTKNQPMNQTHQVPTQKYPRRKVGSRLQGLTRSSLPTHLPKSLQSLANGIIDPDPSSKFCPATIGSCGRQVAQPAFPLAPAGARSDQARNHQMSLFLHFSFCC